ncbi:hypothetical protein [Actinomadura fibrosa]|uniref:Secreted protein n=1 Tax=Actinomadura fibrosa TaxID=111802 RepID=A0ABW2XXF8_9ACTN|nr:hypothetical protein [Actinomadura fibrosa]
MNGSVKAALVAVAVSTTAGIGAAAPAQAAPQAPAAAVQRAVAAGDTSGDVHILARRSFKCKRNSRDVVNLSWKNGTFSTKIYFNNHCKQRKSIRVITKTGALTRHRDFTLPGKTKDYILYRHGAAVKVTNIKPNWKM